MPRTHEHPAPPHRLPALSITELAVDPADVDRTAYPVRLRLSRRLEPHEAEALATLLPHTTVEQQSIVVDEARLDDVAHDIGRWSFAVERAARIAEERAGADARHATDASDHVLAEHRGRGTSPESYMH